MDEVNNASTIVSTTLNYTTTTSTVHSPNASYATAASLFVSSPSLPSSQTNISQRSVPSSTSSISPTFLSTSTAPSVGHSLGHSLASSNCNVSHTVLPTSPCSLSSFSTPVIYRVPSMNSTTTVDSCPSVLSTPISAGLYSPLFENTTPTPCTEDSNSSGSVGVYQDQFPLLWRKRTLADENTASMNKEDFEIVPNGLQQVLIYVVKNLNELTDRFSSIQQQISDFRDSIDDKDDMIDQKIEQRLDNKNIRIRLRPVNDDGSEDGGDDDDSSSSSGSLPDPSDYRFEEMKLEIERLKSQCYELDCRLIGCESYSRRDCLIISGIPSKISDDALETEVLNVLHHMGVKNVDRKEVSALHRLPKRRPSPYPPRVIVKFVNRKIVDKTLAMSAAGEWKNVRKEMGYGLRFYSCMSPKNEEVLRNCKTLKDEGIIHSYFIRNGYVMIVENEGDRPFKILHPKVLKDQFDGP